MKEFFEKYWEYWDIKEHEENTYRIKELTMCRERLEATPHEEIINKPLVVLGTLIDIGIKQLLHYEPKTYSKKVNQYTVHGNPDIVFENKVVEIKFSIRKILKEWDLLQLRLYMWITDIDKGELWYFTPLGQETYEITNPATTLEVLDLIEKPRMPMWRWECDICPLEQRLKCGKV